MQLPLLCVEEMVVVKCGAMVAATVDELVVVDAVTVVAVVVVMVVPRGAPVPAADITALQSTDWYLGCVLWSMRPSRGRR